MKYATHYKCYLNGDDRSDILPSETHAQVRQVPDDFQRPPSQTFDNILTGWYDGVFDTIEGAMGPAIADRCCTSILDATVQVDEWTPYPVLWSGKYKRDIELLSTDELAVRWGIRRRAAQVHIVKLHEKFRMGRKMGRDWFLSADEAERHPPAPVGRPRRKQL